MGWAIFGAFLFLVVLATDIFLGVAVGALVGFLCWLILRHDRRERVIQQSALLSAAAFVVTHIGTVVIGFYRTGDPDGDLVKRGFQLGLVAAAIVPILLALVSLSKPKAA